MGVHVTQESEEVGQQVTMWDVDGVYRLSVASFTDALLRGTDASTSVGFWLQADKSEDLDEALERLLDLGAVRRKRSRNPVMRCLQKVVS